MAARKKARLGRGLEALLGDVRPQPADDQAGTAGKPAASSGGVAAVVAVDNQLRQLPIELLQRGKYQPRTVMDEAALKELAESIRAQGVVQPLLVRPLARGRFEIIAGERRWRGAQLAGLAVVPAVVREINDRDSMAVAIIENIQRQDLNAIEEATGLQRLLDEFGLTHQQIGESIGRSRAAVSNALRLLSLAPAAKKHLESGGIEMGHARALLGLPTAKQGAAAAKVAAAGMTVRQTEMLVKRILAGGDEPPDPPQKDADITRLESDLSTRIGARVAILHGPNRGRLIIHYHSLDELDGILERIR